MNDVEAPDMARQLRRWGPIALIALIAIVVVVVLVSSGGDDDDDTTAGDDTVVTDDDAAGDDTAPADDDTTPADDDTDDTAPDDDDDDAVADPEADGLVFWSEAEAAGTTADYEWGDSCDTDLGQLAYPNYFAAECLVPFDGDNGGETYPGVTADTIKIVWYTSPEVDPVLDYITGPINNDDTPDEIFATIEGLSEFYGSFLETYGRTVEVIRYDATGPSDDEVSARADAETIARDIRPFMVWNAPTLVSIPFAETLAANDVMCACGGGEAARDNLPYLHTIEKSAEQSRVLLAEYIGKRLQGGNAIHSGDFVDEERVFGYLYLETSDQSVAVAEAFRDRLRDDWGVELAEMVPYELNPATLQEQAATKIARLKDAGVTSIIFTGDPIAPRDITIEATAQEYFPEWILAGTALVDTNVFSRTYDQQQWAHAFGMSNRAVDTDRRIEGFYFLYDWFHGTPPPADDTIEVLWHPSLFFTVLQGIGPDLTPENYMESMLNSAPTARGAITQPSISWGSKDGLWPEEFQPDLNGIDDVSEIWWDTETEGLDELEQEGKGVYYWANGGQRYLPGEWPDTPPDAFDKDGAVFFLDEIPASEAPPDYPSSAG